MTGNSADDVFANLPDDIIPIERKRAEYTPSDFSELIADQPDQAVANDWAQRTNAYFRKYKKESIDKLLENQEPLLRQLSEKLGAPYESLASKMASLSDDIEMTPQDIITFAKLFDKGLRHSEYVAPWDRLPSPNIAVKYSDKPEVGTAVNILTGDVMLGARELIFYKMLQQTKANQIYDYGEDKGQKYIIAFNANEMAVAAGMEEGRHLSQLYSASYDVPGDSELKKQVIDHAQRSLTEQGYAQKALADKHMPQEKEAKRFLRLNKDVITQLSTRQSQSI